jgi:tetratricopeptide (TPR) repeat protein
LVGDEPVEQAKLLLKRAAVWEAAGRFSTALRETTRARKIAENMVASGDTWRARTMAFAAMIRQRQERPQDALAAAERAIEVARLADDKAALAQAYSVTSWAHLMLDLPGARELFEEAYSLYQQLDDLVGEADVANNLGGLAYFEGRWADALDYYELSRSGAERLGNVGVAGFAEMNIGEVLVNQRRLDEAESVLKNAIRVLRSIGLTYGANFAEMQLGRALMARGSFESAETVLVAVRDELIELGLASGSYESALYLAECLCLRGDPAAAMALLDEASGDNPDEASIYFATEARVRASALGALSRRTEALDVVERGMEEARQRGLDYDLALLLEIDANLRGDGETEKASEHRSEALTIFERLGVITNLAVESTVG